MPEKMFSEKNLGFGLMRLPEAAGKIDIEQISRMVDSFLGNGFTYFDTAYVYPGSEETFRKVVVDRYTRSRYTIATKMASWKLSETFTPQKCFRNS